MSTESFKEKVAVSCIAERKRNVFSSCCLKLSITMYGFIKSYLSLLSATFMNSQWSGLLWLSHCYLTTSELVPRLPDILYMFRVKRHRCSSHQQLCCFLTCCLCLMQKHRSVTLSSKRIPSDVWGTFSIWILKAAFETETLVVSPLQKNVHC